MYGTFKIVYQIYHSKQENQKRKSKFFIATILSFPEYNCSLSESQDNPRFELSRERRAAEVEQSTVGLCSWTPAAEKSGSFSMRL